MTKNFLTFLQIIFIPLILTASYLTKDSSWIFIYGVFLTITLILTCISILMFSYDTELIGWKFKLSISYDALAFLYLTFSHDFLLAILQLVKTGMMILLFLMVRHVKN